MRIIRRTAMVRNTELGTSLISGAGPRSRAPREAASKIRSMAAVGERQPAE